MGFSCTTVKFRGLTDYTQKSDYLSYVSNELQSSTTPYDATYKVTYDNDSTVLYFAPTEGAFYETFDAGIQVADNCYAGKYKIYSMWYCLNKSMNIGRGFDGSVSEEIVKLTSNVNMFDENVNFLKNFPVNLDIYPVTNAPLTLNDPYTNEYQMILTPSASLTGTIYFSIKYYDKYLVIPKP